MGIRTPLLIFLCFSQLYLAFSLVVTDSHIKAARFITPFDSFAFGTKGSLLITAQVEVDDLEDAQKVIADTDKLAIFICPSKHYSVLVTDASSILKICGDGANPTSPTSSDCKVAPVNGTTTYITFDSQAIYRFCAVNCMKLTSQYQYTWINMSYTAMNEMSQLPIGAEPYPAVYLVAIFAWIVVAACWAFLIVKMQNIRNTLHNFLTAVILLKLTVAIIGWVYWNTYAKNGRRIDELNYLRSFVFAVSETGFFCALLLAGKGWRILRPNLPTSEVRTIALALILLLTTLLFFSFYSDDYYVLVMLVLYFFLLPKIFSNVSRNIKTLKAQLWVIEIRGNVQADPADIRALQAKLHLYKFLRTGLAFYLTTLVLLNILRFLLPWTMESISSALNEVLSLLMIGSVCWALRPTDSGVYHLTRDLPAIVQLQALLNLDPNGAANDNNTTERVVPWDMSTTFIVEYPHEGWVANVLGDTKKLSPTKRLKRKQATVAIPMAVCVEERYDRENSNVQH